MPSKRLNVRAILADKDLRRALMVPTIQATQAREGIETTREQAERAYYVVTEAERAAFFELEPFKGGKKGEQDARHQMFVKSLRSEADGVRHDVARRDFAAIETSPLAFERIAQVAHLFREYPTILPHHGSTHVGVFTHDDSRFLRERWECALSDDDRWVPFAKGGEYCRFYYDSTLVVDWSPSAQAYYRAEGRIRDLGLYFRGGLTWVPRTQRGFSLRVLPADTIFGNKGPALLPRRNEDLFYLLGVGNSWLFDYLTRAFAAFGSYEAKSIERLPIPVASGKGARRIAELAQGLYGQKLSWNKGNEVSREFDMPWALWRFVTGDSIPRTLEMLARFELEEEAKLRASFSELNDEVFGIYGIPKTARALIEKSLGERPPEVIWPQMEGKTVEQKRMEHVWRLLSFAVKRVVESDDDGIVPFNRATGDTPLVERVRRELAVLFPERDESQLEVEIVNELKRSVKGYRKCASLDDWLANAYFEYHASLYKSRPIFWHIASAQGTTPFAFGAIVHYHRFDKNRMAKLRANYVRDTIEELRREAGLADKARRAEDRIELQAKLEEVQALDRKLQLIQEGNHEGSEGGLQDFRILTPWKKPEARPKGWNPDIDDGVKVNIAPLDRAGALRILGVAG